MSDDHKAICIVLAFIVCAAVFFTALGLHLAHDTPVYECWTPTHITIGSDPAIYTSDGQVIEPNGHEGLFVEGRPWCGWVGTAIGAYDPWIEDGQGPAPVHTSG